MHEQLCETIKKHYDAIFPYLKLYNIKEVRYKRLLKILENHGDEAALGLMLSFMQCLDRDHQLLQGLFTNPLYRSDTEYFERALEVHGDSLPELKLFRARRRRLRDNLNYYLGKNHVKTNKAKTKQPIGDHQV